MKLNFQLLDQPITIEAATTLVVEDVSAFSKLIKDVYQYEETTDLKIYDNQYKEIKSSELLVVTDILGFGVNVPSVLKLIYGDLEQQLNDKPEVKSEIDNLSDTIKELIGRELLNHELNLIQDEITILELFKALGIKIEARNNSIYEKLLEIIEVYKYLSKKKMLVLVNTYVYLKPEEIIELHRYISLNQLDVLLIEPRKTNGILQYILDEDYFLTSENLV